MRAHAIALIVTISFLPSVLAIPASIGQLSIDNQITNLDDSGPTNVTLLGNLTATPIIIEQCREPRQYLAVKRAFGAAQEAVSWARNDVGAGVNSAYGFYAMFKTPSAVRYIWGYINNIYDYQGSINLRPDPYTITRPHFVCVTPDSKSIYAGLGLDYDPWQRCLSPRPGGQPQNAFYADVTGYIFLCPKFFQQPVTPPRSAQNCPTVVNNKYNGDIKRFYKSYQVYTLLYELIRFYLGTSALSPNSNPKEIFEWNLCVRYPPNFSLANPTNMLLYIAFAAQSCRQHPVPRRLATG